MFDDQYLEKCVDCYSAMCHVIANTSKGLMTNSFFFWIYITQNKGMNGCLQIIPVKALGTILDNK